MPLAFSPADPDSHAAASRAAVVDAEGDSQAILEMFGTPSPALPSSSEFSQSDQLIRLDWFQHGIEQQNCALFEAALYPIRAFLAEKVCGQLAKERSESLVADHLTLNLIVDDLIMYAFEQSERWNASESISAWLVTLIDELLADMQD